MLTTSQFEHARHLALRLAGIELVDRHREILYRRSLRLGILKSNVPETDCAEGDSSEADGLNALLRAAELGDPAASQRLISLFTTNLTGFFRHPEHFDVAADRALRAAKQRGQARCWSAAAATGEEPYSLAIALLEIFGQEEPRARILATDIDVEALAVARLGEYSVRALAGVDAERLECFFTEATGNLRSIKPAVHRLVKFGELNLVDVEWPDIEGPFDVIFCRNVLMYLEASYRYSVVERLASLLEPDGLLILDPTEHLGKAGHFFAPAGTDGVYARRRAPFSSATRESGRVYR
jgi:chemotaxis protein methyltransferase CheR